MFQTLIVFGNVGRDPEMRYTPEGKAVCSFSVATQDGFGDSKKTIWFRATAWEKLAETCNQYLAKGSKVLIEGRLQADANGNPRTWTDNTGATRASFEMTASVVRFLSAKPGAPVDASGEDAGANIPF